MTTVSHGKPYAGNPHVRFEEGDSASAEPRRKSLLHKLKTKYAAGMRDELEALLGCPVEVVEDREAKYPCALLER